MTGQKQDMRFYLEDLIPVHLLRTERPFEFFKISTPDSRNVFVVRGPGLDETLQTIYQRAGGDLSGEDDGTLDEKTIRRALEIDLAHYRQEKKETGGTPASEFLRVIEKFEKKAWWQLPFEVIERYQASQTTEKAQIGAEHWSEIFIFEEWQRVLSIISCDDREDPLIDFLKSTRTKSFKEAMLRKIQRDTPRLFP